jgi:hypothetical protein
MSKDKSQSEFGVFELRDIMNSHDGKNVLRRILQSTGYFDDTFNEDPYRSAYSAGRRSLGVELVEEMKRANPTALIDILQEPNDG